MTAWLGEGRAEGGAVTLTPSQSGEGGLRSWRQLNQLNCTQTGLRAGLGLGFEAAARGRLLDSGRNRVCEPLAGMCSARPCPGHGCQVSQRMSPWLQRQVNQN